MGGPISLGDLRGKHSAVIHQFKSQQARYPLYHWAGYQRAFGVGSLTPFKTAEGYEIDRFGWIEETSGFSGTVIVFSTKVLIHPSVKDVYCYAADGSWLFDSPRVNGSQEFRMKDDAGENFMYNGGAFYLIFK